MRLIRVSHGRIGASADCAPLLWRSCACPSEKHVPLPFHSRIHQERYDATFAVALPAGPYDVRLYIKDTADHTIFLYHDYFRFTVE